MRREDVHGGHSTQRALPVTSNRTMVRPMSNRRDPPPDGRGKVLFDLVHPADALFFYNPIKALQSAGADIRIASRHKDVLVPLLDELGLPHLPLTEAGEGRVGLARELLQRDYRLWKLARAFRPNAMVGFGGVAISHVGKLTGIPSLSFYDTEHAALQIRLALPFISEWHVPQSWRGPEARGRTHRFAGGKQFAYLHPDHFKPSEALATAAGWEAGRDNFLVRLVAWTANHDRGRSGLSPAQLRDVVARLQRLGKVHISAEGALPEEFEPLRYRCSAIAFHHLLAHCRLYVGESITVASEAVALGVPALLQIDKEYGYVADQEGAGLIRRFGPEGGFEEALENALIEDRKAFRGRAREFVAIMGDVNLYVVSQIERVLERRRGGGATASGGTAAIGR
jgi:predicted glycosyltransferase